MKFIFLSFALILFNNYLNAQFLNDTTFYYKQSGEISDRSGADYYIEVSKNSIGSFLLKYYEKDKNNEWKLAENSKVFSVNDNGLLTEAIYKKKKLLETVEIKWNKENGGWYHFKERSNTEYFSRYPIPLVKDSIQTIYYPHEKYKEIECKYENNIAVSCTLFGRAGNIIERDFLLTCDQQPTYDGKNLEYFREVVQQHMIYPPEAVENGIFGRVIVQFVVKSDGSLGNIIVLRSAHKLLDDESIRAIKATTPLWSPGYNKGKPVNVMMVMPLIFQLK